MVTAGIISVVIRDHFGGGDHFDGGDHFGGGTGLEHFTSWLSNFNRIKYSYNWKHEISSED